MARGGKNSPGWAKKNFRAITFPSSRTRLQRRLNMLYFKLSVRNSNGMKQNCYLNFKTQHFSLENSFYIFKSEETNRELLKPLIKREVFTQSLLISCFVNNFF